jgi:hypothetical protein
MTTPALDAAALERLISAAVAAPSVHNSQPWRFRLSEDISSLELRVDEDRPLPATDPDGRALYLSVGAALLNLRTAARHLGWAPEVRLLPDSEAPDLVAAVVLDRPSPVALPLTGRLYDAIWRRHTVRTPFTGEPVPGAVLDAIAEAARAEEADLSFPGREESVRLLDLAVRAERRTAADPARSAENRGAVREPGGPARGIPVDALGPFDAAGRMPVRDFGATGRARSAMFEAEPCLAVLTTARDRPRDWIRAGMALEHALLLATVHHVRAGLLHQVVEWPDLRAAAQDPDRGPGHVQMLVRLGYGAEGSPTPRLPVGDVLEISRP